MREAFADSTLRKYEPIFHRFLDSQQRRGFNVQRAAKEQLLDRVMDFVADDIVQHKFYAAKTALCGVAHGLKLARNVDIWAEPRIKIFGKGLDRLVNSFKTVKEKRDIIPIDALVHYIVAPPAGADVFKVLLASAVISLGIRCIRRAAELVELEEDQLTVKSPGVYNLRIRFHKANRAGQLVVDVPFEAGKTAADPVRCLDAYLRAAKGQSLDSWRGTPGRLLFTNAQGRPLRTADVAGWIREIMAHGGVQGKFSAHCMRITGACLGVLGGLTLEQVIAIGGWRSSRVLDYLRGLVAVLSRATERMGL